MVLFTLTGTLIVSEGRPALSSPPPTMRLDPSIIKVDSRPQAAFTVDIMIEGATNLGAFAFVLLSDPDFVKPVEVQVGPFLGSTGRNVTCQPAVINERSVTFGCNTQGPGPPGPDGSGVLASVEFSVQGLSVGDTSLLLTSCNAADVLGSAILSDVCKDSKVTINPPTPTTTPTKPALSVQKLPRLQNLFLTRQGDKIPPAVCEDSTNLAELPTALLGLIKSPDPKDPAQTQQLGSFEFEVRFDSKLVCVDIEPGTAAQNMICFIADMDDGLPLEGIARIGCVSKGKEGPFPDTSTPEGRHLATVRVRPQPELYSQIIANQENGIVVQLLNQGCNLSDLQGHPITIYSCEDADVTVRYLQGDVEPDCLVDALDQQAIAFRWGADQGDLLYNERFDLEPSGGGVSGDGDLDIKDMQFVSGRHGSTCAAPHPRQPPVNPKAGPTPTPTPTPTVTLTPTPPPKPRINKTPQLLELLLSAPPATQLCEDSPDAVSFDLVIKDPIDSADPKEPSQLQQLGAFEFEVRFDPLYVCIDVAPGDIPQGEMHCISTEGQNTVHFGCLTTTTEIPPDPQPPGVIAVITVRPHPGVYDLLVPGEGGDIITQISNQDCQLSDLLGHPIKSFGCGDATVIIRYP